MALRGPLFGRLGFVLGYCFAYCCIQASAPCVTSGAKNDTAPQIAPFYFGIKDFADGPVGEDH